MSEDHAFIDDDGLATSSEFGFSDMRAGLENQNDHFVVLFDEFQSMPWRIDHGEVRKTRKLTQKIPIELPKAKV